MSVMRPTDDGRHIRDETDADIPRCRRDTDADVVSLTAARLFDLSIGRSALRGVEECGSCTERTSP